MACVRAAATVPACYAYFDLLCVRPDVPGAARSTARLIAIAKGIVAKAGSSLLLHFFVLCVVGGGGGGAAALRLRAAQSDAALPEERDAWEDGGRTDGR